MGEHPSLSSKQIEQILIKHGFTKQKRRGKGSHTVYTKTGKNRFYYVNVPKRRDHAPKTMENIIRCSGLKKDEFYGAKKNSTCAIGLIHHSDETPLGAICL